MGVFFFLPRFWYKKLQKHPSLLTFNECKSLGVATISTYMPFWHPCHVTLWHDVMMTSCHFVMWWRHESLCHFHGVTLLRDEVITWSREFSCYLVVMPLARWTLDFSLYGACNAFTLKLDIFMSIPWHSHSYPKCDNLHEGSSIAAQSETRLLCSLKFCCSRPSSAAHWLKFDWKVGK